MNKNIIKYFNNLPCKKILKKLKFKNVIANGTWGTIYKLNINNNFVSLKFQPIYNDKKHLYIDDNRNIDLEIELLTKLSIFKLTNNCLHFPYFYFSKKCNNNIIIVYEYFNYNLLHFFINTYNFNEFKSIMQQILISIYYFQKITGYYHNDINLDNFLLNNTSLDTITYPDLNISIKTYGKYICLWDYANAIIIPKKNKSNVDIVQFKSMIPKYITNIIYKEFKHKHIIEFCKQYKDFTPFLNKLKTQAKLKWNHISNIDIKMKKVQKTILKAIIYWIIENNLLYNLYDIYYNHDIYPTKNMLDWINTIPDDINDCIQFIRNNNTTL
jgi:hypothetical protein